VRKLSKCEQLHMAVQDNDLDKVRMLLTTKNVNSILGGYAPLHWAAQEGFIEVAEILIETGADLNIKDDSGFSPLYKALDHMEMAELLVSKGADVNLRRNNNSTPLVTACAYGRSEMVDLLIRSGADVNASDDYGDTPIVFAVIYGHYDIVERLIKEGADINVEGVDVDVDETLRLKLPEIAKNHNHMDVYDLLVSNMRTTSNETKRDDKK
jgi:ankyrin repeat protein